MTEQELHPLVTVACLPYCSHSVVGYQEAMCEIIVTGGAGRLGQRVIRELLAHDYTVLSVDRQPPDSTPCRFLQADLTKANSVHDALRGARAVIHLGAVPGPTAEAAATIYENNVISTYHVLESAAAHGLKKVVFASSVFALGWHPDPEVYWPQYVPVDEDHPLTPFEAYGLSKQIGEHICATVSRRSGMPTVSLRIMNVIQEDGYGVLPWTTPTKQCGERFVFWPYVDVRDAATACRLALEAETTEHEALFIAAEDIRFDATTEVLLREFAPQVEIRTPLQGKASVVSIQKAQRLIGYQPKNSWQTRSKT